MLIPSEMEAKAVLPYLRAIIAKRLMEGHGLTQQQAASRLGITQAAVSNYRRQTRGKIAKFLRTRDIEVYADVIASMIMDGADEIEITERFDQALKFIRRTRLLCDIHREMDPKYDIDSCHVCDRAP